MSSSYSAEVDLLGAYSAEDLEESDSRSSAAPPDEVLALPSAAHSESGVTLDDWSESVDPRFLGHEGFVTVEEESDMDGESQAQLAEGEESMEDWADKELRKLRGSRKSSTAELSPRIPIAPPSRIKLEELEALAGLNRHPKHEGGRRKSARATISLFKDRRRGRRTASELSLRDRVGTVNSSTPAQVTQLPLVMQPHSAQQQQEQQGQAGGDKTGRRKWTLSSRGLRSLTVHDRHASTPSIPSNAASNSSNSNNTAASTHVVPVDFIAQPVASRVQLKVRATQATCDQMFAFVIDPKFASDEDYFHSYFFTLNCFDRPLRVFRSLALRYVQLANMEETDDRFSGAQFQRLQSALAFWVCNMWSLFSADEALHKELNAFLRDTADGRARQHDLHEKVSALKLAQQRSALERDHLFQRAPSKGVKSRPPTGLMDINDSLEEVASDEEDTASDDDVEHDTDETATFESPNDVRATLVGAEKYDATSRPMGLFGVVQETDRTLWELCSDTDPWEFNAGRAAWGTQSVPRLDSVPRERSDGLQSPPSKPISSPRLKAFNAIDLAQQLTLVESFFFRNMSVTELEGLKWKEGNRDACPNVLALLEWRNKIAAWVQWEILSYRTAEDRRKALIRFLRLLQYLSRIQNYHTFFSIWDGLDSVPVTRLGDHEHLPIRWRARYKRYAHLASATNDYAKYRALKARATHFPFFPDVGLYLQDLSVVEAMEDSWASEDDGLVNVEKIRKLGKIFKEITYLQRMTQYRFSRSRRILRFLQDIDGERDDPQIWEASFALLDKGSDPKTRSRSFLNQRRTVSHDAKKAPPPPAAAQEMERGN